MGTHVDKASVGCTDVNVQWASQQSTKRGQWLSAAGVWQWDSQGPVWVTAGNQNPVKVLLDGPIAVGTEVRIGSTVFENLGRWWY